MTEIPKNGHPRERLSVDLPSGTLTALKIHAARQETTIREVVTDLIKKELINKGTHS
ncbi:hypothetical protein FHX10_003009 [Rhizobium sp. BK591]|uniref:hypothetical protein n=1 Tax=Rhizobium sp. BK591 TaxID=2586985 RepID=UPI0016074302|nr:hypothetical protein [Rhizobium sp. BK591]MBB3743510.1 hypothetical protein [Rhizobium sp. BK591]